MRVSDIMTASVDSIRSTDSIAYAARRMAGMDVGALPILTDGKLVGIVTDRDIAIRALAADIAPDVPVRRIMSDRVATCRADDDVETVLALMSREQIRRMPVCADGREAESSRWRTSPRMPRTRRMSATHLPISASRAGRIARPSTWLSVHSRRW